MTPVELVAYHGEGYEWLPGRGRPESITGCPSADSSPLTDEPLWLSLHFAGSWSSNSIPEGAPWLLAVGSDGSPFPDLPRLSRLRGHMGDPAFAHCAASDRIFVVDEVLETIEEQRPLEPAEADYGDWQWHVDEERRFRLGYPPGWRSTTTGDGAIQLRTDSVAHSVVSLRVTEAARAAPTTGETGGESWAPNLFVQHASPGVTGELVPSLEGLIYYCGDGRGLTGGCIEVVFKDGGLDYVLRHEYGTGFEAEPEALRAFNDIANAFQIDDRATVTPVPAPKETLGAGPFWSHQQAEDKALEMIPYGPWEVTDAELVSEADALRLNRCDTRRDDPGNMWYPYPDGVWIVELTGSFDDRQTVFYTYLDAETGFHICTAEQGRPAQTGGAMRPGTG